MLSHVGISVPAALTSNVMEVDDDSSESIMALMQSLVPPQQTYLPLPTWTHSLDVPLSLSSAFGPPAAASTSKGKGKATLTSLPTLAQEANEPESSTAVNEQLAHLLQQLYEAEVPEDVSADVLDYPVVQLALSQVLNKLDVVQNQRDEAHMDLFHSALGNKKWVVTPPNSPEAKKACTKPSVFVKESLIQRAPLVPYNDMMPAGDD
ncbi:hypothetical protein C0989_009438 [Termitomyces sp. Mn162]|nr:hypothetical protein C0989_009438 [Termitomyces sp. Mn162]